ncbi:hypothetical protein SDC9_99716 [bioreactor metagenome]|uniref:Low-affinity inorganic phosphate transporter 1 n=2 Tax=root TaxID=1 RepID=A0A645AIA3_9ZZZZ
MAAEASSAAVILASSHLGFALSTTHVATGSILGTGLGRRGAEVRWGVALRMVVAWLVTLPAAALVGAAMYGIANGLSGVAGGWLGPFVVFAMLLAMAGYLVARSRRTPIGAHNVNDDWDTGLGPTPAPSTSA